MMRHELFEVGSYDYSDLDDRLDKPVEWTEDDLKLIAENYRGGIPLTEEHDRVYIGIGNNICYENGKLFIDVPDELDMEGFDHFHLTGIFPAISESSRSTLLYLIEKAKNNGLTTSFDPNLRLSLWKDQQQMVEIINKIAFRCDTVLPGIGEGKILTGYEHERDIADFYLSKGVKNVVIKMGPQGAYVKTQTEEKYVDGYKVKKVIDTVGAGDGFAVGFISGLLEGKDVKECADRANAIGALQVMHKGDNEGLPTNEQLLAFMKKKSL